MKDFSIILAFLNSFSYPSSSLSKSILCLHLQKFDAIACKRKVLFFKSKSFVYFVYALPDTFLS